MRVLQAWRAKSSHLPAKVARAALAYAPLSAPAANYRCGPRRLPRDHKSRKEKISRHRGSFFYSKTSGNEGPGRAVSAAQSGSRQPERMKLPPVISTRDRIGCSSGRQPIGSRRDRIGCSCRLRLRVFPYCGISHRSIEASLLASSGWLWGSELVSFLLPPIWSTDASWHQGSLVGGVFQASASVGALSYFGVFASRKSRTVASAYFPSLPQGSGCGQQQPRCPT